MIKCSGVLPIVDTPSNGRTRSSEYTGIAFADVRREELNDCQARSSAVLRSKQTALQVKEAAHQNLDYRY
jgi:hypothetical protein